MTLALGLLEAGVRLEATSRQGRPLPGASLLFAPLVLVALLEPLATRLVGAHFCAAPFGLRCHPVDRRALPSEIAARALYP